MFPDLMDESDRGQVTFADSAYVGQEEALQKYGLKDEICEKGYHGNPLTDEQREENRKKSVIRSRVEHVFGFMEGAIRVRVYGRCDARADSADHRHCESHRTHLPEMSNVQYVQVRAICKGWNKIT